VDAGGLGGINRRLAAIEAQQRRLGTSGNNADYYRFRMCATSPPSTSVVVTGGFMWSESVGDMQYNPGGTYDLLNFSNCRSQGIPFTIPYGYTYLWVAVTWDGEELTSCGTGSATYYGWFEEFDTALEAEEASMTPGVIQLNNWSAASYGAFCGCLILRNNGDVSRPNQVMEIDPVNRGRSYIWRNRPSTATRNIN
jgi:hypothetical protein